MFNNTSKFKKERPIISGAMSITIFDETNQPNKIDLREFNKNIITFGRSDDNDIIINSPIVGRKHGHFKIQGEQCFIEDLNSTNGIILNGDSIESQVLFHGDLIRIDDGVEAIPEGVLFIFSQSDENVEWHNLPLPAIGTITIGCDVSCDIHINDKSVSKIHAKIEKFGSDFYIYDKSSKTGIIINGKKVNGKQKLNEKDFINITNSTFIFTQKSISYSSSVAIGIKNSTENGESINIPQVQKIREYINDFESAKNSIADEDVSKEIDIIKAVLNKIVAWLKEEKYIEQSSKQLEELFNYHFPTIIKVLKNYHKLENALETKKRIMELLPCLKNELETVLKNMQQNEMFDIDTDLDLLETKLSDKYFIRII